MRRLLSVQYDPQSERVEIHMNDLGWEALLGFIKQLKEPGCAELSLFTEAWGGDEQLTEERINLNEGVGLIHHLRMRRWGDGSPPEGEG